MWLLGLILIAVGALISSVVLFWIGVILFVIGLAAYFVPARHDTRRWYW